MIHGKSTAENSTFILPKHLLERMDESRALILLKSLLQHIPDTNIASVLESIKGEIIVVKVQFADAANKEHEVSLALQNQKGIVKFECIFFCNGSKEYSEAFGSNNIVPMGVILMQHFKHGDFGTYLKSDQVEKSIVKKILVIVIKNYATAFLETGFTHGDFYPKNIFLDTLNKPFIGDFEKSTFTRKAISFWRDIDDMIGEVSRFFFDRELTDVCRTFVFPAMAYNKEPTKDQIDNIVKAIKKNDLKEIQFILYKSLVHGANLPLV